MPKRNEVRPALREAPEAGQPDQEIGDLVRQAQIGNVSAISELYLSHHQQIFRFIWSRVYDPHEAEDLTMEVFIRMLNHLSSYQDRSVPFRAWLYEIARNLVIDRLRRNGHHQTLPLEDFTNYPVGGDSLEDVAEYRLTLSLVQQLLSQIHPDEAEVVSLRFLGGLSLQETAYATQKTVAAVKALQHRGLASLKQFMNPEQQVQHDRSK